MIEGVTVLGWVATDPSPSLFAVGPLPKHDPLIVIDQPELPGAIDPDTELIEDAQAADTWIGTAKSSKDAMDNRNIVRGIVGASFIFFSAPERISYRIYYVRMKNDRLQFF